MTKGLAKQKRPVGRPSKYKPEYCERVLELAKEGLGWVDYAAEFEVDRVTLYDWAEAHEDFSTALRRAKILEQKWWEAAGRNGLGAERFNALVWKTSMQARFRDDYTERKVQEHTGANGGAIKHEHQSKLDLSGLNEDQRDQLRELLAIAKRGAEQ